MVADAWRALTTGRPRPAALILPQDLMAAPAATLPIDLDFANPHPPLPDDAINEAVRLLSEATHPVILAGGGAVWAGAAAEIRRLAERLGCPVVTSLNAKGILDEREPRALGHARSLRGRVATTHADVMLAIGCRFTEVMTGFRKMQVPDRLIQIDLNPTEIGMNYPARVGIVADAKDALQAILARLPAKTSSDWRDLWPSARAASRPKAEWLIETLRAELPDDAVVFTDASEMAYRMHTDYQAYLPRSFFYPSNYIALGWGFPAAIGAAVALPDRVVVSFSGDGGFVMTCQELATAARYRLNMIILVHNDSAYGAIKHLQRIKCEGRYRDTDLNNPDFGRLAEAFGIPSRRAMDAAGFREALREAISLRGPMLIEVPDEWRYLRH
jgi:acetolactate synthase-1/2/3 large subunit